MERKSPVSLSVYNYYGTHNEDPASVICYLLFIIYYSGCSLFPRKITVVPVITVVTAIIAIIAIIVFVIQQLFLLLLFQLFIDNHVMLVTLLFTIL